MHDHTSDSERNLLPFDYDYGARVSIHIDHGSLLTTPPITARNSMYEFGYANENGNLLNPNTNKIRYLRRNLIKPKYPSVSFIPLIVCISVVLIFALILILVVILFGGCYFD